MWVIVCECVHVLSILCEICYFKKNQMIQNFHYLFNKKTKVPGKYLSDVSFSTFPCYFK